MGFKEIVGEALSSDIFSKEFAAKGEEKKLAIVEMEIKIWRSFL